MPHALLDRREGGKDTLSRHVTEGREDGEVLGEAQVGLKGLLGRADLGVELLDPGLRERGGESQCTLTSAGRKKRKRDGPEAGLRAPAKSGSAAR